VVLVIGGLAAKALARLVRGTTAEAGFSNPDVLAAVTKVSVWAFTIVVAVNQVGIATELINTLLIGVVGALALASGLAFGLGGRDRAAEILDRLGRRTDLPGPWLERATVPVKEPARDATRAPAGTPPGPGVAARPAPFDEDWMPRSGRDRRRVAREGMDRRVVSSR
jgi:hypothetical protein